MLFFGFGLCASWMRDADFPVMINRIRLYFEPFGISNRGNNEFRNL
jgi:hypothetical protein